LPTARAKSSTTSSARSDRRKLAPVGATTAGSSTHCECRHRATGGDAVSTTIGYAPRTASTSAVTQLVKPGPCVTDATATSSATRLYPAAIDTLAPSWIEPMYLPPYAST
jgi:hypothetical protein